MVLSQLLAHLAVQESRAQLGILASQTTNLGAGCLARVVSKGNQLKPTIYEVPSFQTANVYFAAGRIGMNPGDHEIAAVTGLHSGTATRRRLQNFTMTLNGKRARTGMNSGQGWLHLSQLAG